MNMKPIMLVLASAIWIPIGAYADNSSVIIYGTLNVDLESVKRDGATSGAAALNSLVGAPGLTPVNSQNRSRVSSNSSNIGFRGSEDLGDGLKAIWQIESGINVDTGGGNFATRDSYVGFSGGWGALLLAGARDTPYKRGVQGKDPFFATGIATQKGILGSPGFNVISVGASSETIAANTAGFDARMNNSVVYQSPQWNGLSFEVAYGTNESKTTTKDPQALSAGVMYENGPLWLSYAYEQRKDIFGLTGIGAGNTGTSSKDRGNKLGAGFKFGNTDLLAVWERLEYENSGTVAGVTAFDRDAWLISASHRFGSNRISASYTKARDGNCTLASGAACSTDGLGAKQYILGYAYTLSKRTDLYAHYTKIDNDFAASYFFGVGGPASALPGGPGSDPQGVALGIRHRF